METTAAELIALIGKIEPLLSDISDASASDKPVPGKWSKKEILGHLIDSAANNQQKFVRTMLEGNPVVDFVGYNQDEWVQVQRYNEHDWFALIGLWVSINRHLAHIMIETDPVKLKNQIRVGGQGPFTLEFIMSDYVEHLKHHLKQILPEAGLSSSFSMAAYS